MEKFEKPVKNAELKKRFSEWLNERFFDWRGKTHNNLTDFANYLAISQQLVNTWVNGKYLPGPDHVIILFDIYPDFFDHFPELLPANLRLVPRELRNLEREARLEVKRRCLLRDIPLDSPEAESISIEVFKEFGFIWRDTTQPGNDG
jgi:hypothetical protein